MSNKPSSILIIGATGRLGVRVIEALVTQTESEPNIHAFCRDQTKLPRQYRNLCNSTIQGDARSQVDIESALDETKADFVIVAIGNGDNVGKTDIRAASARALAGAMAKPEYGEVRAIIVSSIGAGNSSIRVGLGMGKLLETHLRHILKDHTNQEAAFQNVKNRTDIVRPTGLKDNQETGKVYEFGNNERCPNLSCDRKDVAMWIVEDMYGPTFGGKVINIASKK